MALVQSLITPRPQFKLNDKQKLDLLCLILHSLIVTLIYFIYITSMCTFLGPIRPVFSRFIFRSHILRSTHHIEVVILTTTIASFAKCLAILLAPLLAASTIIAFLPLTRSIFLRFDSIHTSSTGSEILKQFMLVKLRFKLPCLIQGSNTVVCFRQLTEQVVLNFLIVKTNNKLIFQKFICIMLIFVFMLDQSQLRHVCIT